MPPDTCSAQCHTIVSYKLIAILYSLVVSHKPRPPHTDVGNQGSRVSGPCKAGSCSVPSGPMNTTIQQFVFLIVVLADAGGIEIMHNSWQLCIRSHPPSPFLLCRVDKGRRKISPLHTCHEIFVFSCLTHSSGGGYIYARYHTLAIR